MTKENFYPLTYLREIDELRCGATTVGEHKNKPENIWDLVVNLKSDLEEDLKKIKPAIKGSLHPSAVLYAPENILIEAGTEIEACAVLDARSGPIYIGKGTIIRPQAYLRGPLSIGPCCRIGGEVVHSIFYGHSNKGHYGFIGHSYIGEWVNLGAGTTNSNLKNNYGTVKVAINGKEKDSGEQFLGCFIGDYAKLGIGTLINTGTVIGVGANVFGGKLTDKVLPNFAWGEGKRYDLDKFIDSARKMMARRGEKLSQEKEALLRGIY